MAFSSGQSGKMVVVVERGHKSGCAYLREYTALCLQPLKETWLYIAAARGRHC
ncbi:hypothetical protein I79_003713 [Cricetulus griseus]|uniref:Uncharacterized protein n=1 Tax=Cricetulus griseus TaxID=10029 RepID=G3H0P9_CRIGR|nr:hypothetical protein I79_003713 [Cricetulus griseus]